MNVQLVTLDTLADRIRAAHAEAQSAFVHALDRAMTAGDLLIEAKTQLDHGAWLPWLRDACAVSERTAQAYMRLARNRPALEEQIRNGVADIGVRGALALLTEPRCPDAEQPAPTADNPSWTPSYREAAHAAAAALNQVVESGASVARKTHAAVAAGVSLSEWCERFNWSEAVGITYLTWWVRHGADYEAGRPVPPPFADIDGA